MLCWIRVLSGRDRNRIEISLLIAPLWNHQAMQCFLSSSLSHCSILLQVSETGKTCALNVCPLSEPKLPSWNFKNMSKVASSNNFETWNLCPPVPWIIQVCYLSKWKKDSLSSDTASLQEAKNSEVTFILNIYMIPLQCIGPPKQ